MTLSLNKLRAMGSWELVFRGLSAAKRPVERRAVAAYNRLGPGRLDRALRSTDVTPRFFEPLADPVNTRDFYVSHYGGQAQATAARVQRYLSNEFDLLGQRIRLESPIDWHADPMTGARWPTVFYGDVVIAPDGGRRPDVKHVWELNRHQFLIDLAKHYFLTGQQPSADKVRQLVAEWIEQNPYGMGVNWAGTLEVAYRALSWLWARAFTGDQPASVKSMWLTGFLDHGRYLYRHLEHYSSPYNHLVSQAAVLYVLGVLCPELQESPRWRARGRRVLESSLPVQFHADGGSVEQAAGYHHATLGFYLIAALIGRRNGEEFSTGVWNAIEKAIEFSMRMAQPDGRQPAIGDNDDARPIVLEWRDSWDYRYFQAIGSALFDRADFRMAAGRFHEEAFWLLGPAAATEFEQKAQLVPAEAGLAESGYVVIRSNWSHNADYVCFDCGPQAGGLRHDNTPSAAHGHADALSVVATMAGTPILVDPGFYTYNGDRAWERYFRETRAHNTVVVDETDQAIHLEQMAWSNVPHVTRIGCRIHEGRGWAQGEHDGYARLPGRPIHRRTVWLRRGVLVIHDRITSERTHRLELNWQFAPDLQAVAHADRLSLGERFQFAWKATLPLVSSIRNGDATRPEGGWVAPHLGVRVAAPRLTVTGLCNQRADVLTVLCDSQVWPGINASPADGELVITLQGAEETEVIRVTARGIVEIEGRSRDGAAKVLERAAS